MIRLTVAMIALLAIAMPAFAAKDKAEKADKGAKTEESADKGRKVSIEGEAKCAKCALKESDKCQTVIEVENKKGKKMTYALADNKVAKDFHATVCKENKKVTATGTAKKADGKGKFELTADKIEVAKADKK